MKINQLVSIVGFSKGENCGFSSQAVPVLIALLLEKWRGGVAKSTEREQKKEEHFYQEELTD